MKKLNKYDIMGIFSFIVGISFIIHPIIFTDFYADNRARVLLQVVGFVMTLLIIPTISDIVKSFGG